MRQDGSKAVKRPAVARRQASTSPTTAVTSMISSSISSPTPATTTIPLNASDQNHNPPVETLNPDESSPDSYCTVALPAGGIIRFNDTLVVKLDDPLAFSAPCENNTVIFREAPGNSTVISFGDPFYSSIAPQIYTLAATTIISYLLVIILFITPRTFYLGGLRGGGTVLGGGKRLLERSIPFLGSSSGSSGTVGIGRRPLLQKIATITVAASLTIATADTFDVAERQYNQNFMNASALVNEVVGSNEIKITRVVSDAFLWLAQVQTLIRLFPRHKEKVAIKWLGFALVICDTIFSILENFVSESGTEKTRPASFTDAIPALSYLFELALSLIYASCVVYYSLSKRRFAYWHAKMRNVCLVALMSLVAVLIPVVFFIVDVAQPDIATWGEYIRWVGSAAASVVVWEWVERIEALERDEKKDGILGREIFDGDEMLGVVPSDDHNRRGGSSPLSDVDPKDDGDAERGQIFQHLTSLNLRPRIPFRNRDKKMATKDQSTRKASTVVVNGIIGRPPQIASPVSRSDTTSAASTVYAVRYHNPLSPSPAIPENAVVPPEQSHDVDPNREVLDGTTLTNSDNVRDAESFTKDETQNDPSRAVVAGRQIWHSVANPFKRKRAEPPAEVAAHVDGSNMRKSPADRALGLKNKLNTFALSQRQRLSNRTKNKTPLQVTVIPSQRRGARDDAEEAAASTSNANHREANTGNNEAHSRESNETQRRNSMQVMVIPAPARGARTWSPDDMNNGPTPVQEESNPSEQLQSSPTWPYTSTPTIQRQTSPSISFKASPGGRSTNSPSSRSLLRAPDFGRNRAASTTSISKRIGETANRHPGESSSSSTSPLGIRRETPSVHTSTTPFPFAAGASITTGDSGSSQSETTRKESNVSQIGDQEIPSRGALDSGSSPSTIPSISKSTAPAERTITTTPQPPETRDPG